MKSASTSDLMVVWGTYEMLSLMSSSPHLAMRPEDLQLLLMSPQGTRGYHRDGVAVEAKAQLVLGDEHNVEQLQF